MLILTIIYCHKSPCLFNLPCGELVKNDKEARPSVIFVAEKQNFLDFVCFFWPFILFFILEKAEQFNHVFVRGKMIDSGCVYSTMTNAKAFENS